MGRGEFLLNLKLKLPLAQNNHTIEAHLRVTHSELLYLSPYL